VIAAPNPRGSTASARSSSTTSRRTGTARS
jgi:hypothetical protein